MHRRDTGLSSRALMLSPWKTCACIPGGQVIIMGCMHGRRIPTSVSSQEQQAPTLGGLHTSTLGRTVSNMKQKCADGIRDKVVFRTDPGQAESRETWRSRSAKTSIHKLSALGRSPKAMQQAGRHSHISITPLPLLQGSLLTQCWLSSRSPLRPSPAGNFLDKAKN